MCVRTRMNCFLLNLGFTMGGYWAVPLWVYWAPNLKIFISGWPALPCETLVSCGAVKRMKRLYSFVSSWGNMSCLPIWLTWVLLGLKERFCVIITLSETRNLWSMKRWFIMPGLLAWAYPPPSPFSPPFFLKVRCVPSSRGFTMGGYWAVPLWGYWAPNLKIFILGWPALPRETLVSCGAVKRMKRLYNFVSSWGNISCLLIWLTWVLLGLKERFCVINIYYKLIWL